jgi:hypothetical protein
MAELPKTVRIGPITYAVVEVEDLRSSSDNDQKLCGEISYHDGEIRVRPGLNIPLETLFHEIIHGVDHYMGIGLKEKQVRRLSFGLYAALVDNGFLKE